MNKVLRRQIGIKRARKLIRANSNWRHSFLILIKTRKPCSCYMCGHRREVLGKTYQEQKADLELYEEMKAWVEMSYQEWLKIEGEAE